MKFIRNIAHKFSFYLKWIEIAVFFSVNPLYELKAGFFISSDWFKSFILYGRKLFILKKIKIVYIAFETVSKLKHFIKKIVFDDVIAYQKLNNFNIDKRLIFNFTASDFNGSLYVRQILNKKVLRAKKSKMERKWKTWDITLHVQLVIDETTKRIFYRKKIGN